MRKLLIVTSLVILLLSACRGNEQATPSSVRPTEVQETPESDHQDTPPESHVRPNTISPPEATEPVAEMEQVTIRFAVLDRERAIYDDLIRAFEETNPELHVEVVSIEKALGLDPRSSLKWPDNADPQLLSAAEVVEIAVSHQLIQQGLILDLTPFLESDPTFQADDFYPGVLERYRWNGGTWALPIAIDFQLIFFNKDIFDQAGVAYPEVGWTWDEFATKARALTVREGDRVIRWGLARSRPAWRAFVEDHAGPLVDNATAPPTPRFDQPEVTKAVRWFANLVLKEQIMPYTEPEDKADRTIVSKDVALIDKGLVAMWPEAAAAWPRRSQQNNVGVVPFPIDGPRACTTPAWARGLAISAGTTQPTAAWRWVEFLSQQAPDDLRPQTQSFPARRSVAESSASQENLDTELLDTLRYAVAHSYVVNWTLGHEAFDDAMDAILSGKESVEDALAGAQTQAKTKILADLVTWAGTKPEPTFVVTLPEKKPASEDALSITFVPSLSSLDLEPYRDLADRFQEDHPNIVVEIKMPDRARGTPDLQSMAETADCFQWYPGFQDPKDREAILGLNPLLDTDSAFTTDVFFPHVLERFTWQGELWGLPADVMPYVIEYNRDLFGAAGKDYPPLDWTWDDFLALTVALTEGENEAKQYGFVAEVYELNVLLVILERLGAKLVDEDVEPPALSFNDPATVEAVRWYASLVTEHAVKPVFLTDIAQVMGSSAAYLEREVLIIDGRAAMWTGAGRIAAAFSDRSGLNVGVAPLPVAQRGTGGGYLTASGYFISAQTEHPQACWQWITFLTGQPLAMQGLPARRSVAESDDYRQQVGADQAAAYLASIGNAECSTSLQHLSEDSWLGSATFWLSQAFGQIIEGKASIEEALDIAQRLADDYRACILASSDSAEGAMQACMKATDPTLPDFGMVQK